MNEWGGGVMFLSSSASSYNKKPGLILQISTQALNKSTVPGTFPIVPDMLGLVFKEMCLKGFIGPLNPIVRGC